jgi:hypothetical protein
LSQAVQLARILAQQCLEYSKPRPKLNKFHQEEFRSHKSEVSLRGEFEKLDVTPCLAGEYLFPDWCRSEHLRHALIKLSCTDPSEPSINT